MIQPFVLLVVQPDFPPEMIQRLGLAMGARCLPPCSSFPLAAVASGAPLASAWIGSCDNRGDGVVPGDSRSGACANGSDGVG